MMRARWIVAVAVGGLVLTGCGSDAAEDPVVTPSVSPTESAPPAVSPSPEPVTMPSTTPEPEPEPEPGAAPPSLDTLTVTTKGIGPLTVGEPPATNPGAAMIHFDPTFCDDGGLGISEGDPGRWASVYPGATFAVDASDDGVHRLDIWSRDLRTPEGLGIDSTLAELGATYHELEAGSHSGTSHVWWIEDSFGYLVFETQNEADWHAPPAADDPVILMRVLSLEWPSPDWGAANSGNVAGACF